MSGKARQAVAAALPLHLGRQRPSAKALIELKEDLEQILLQIEDNQA